MIIKFLSTLFTVACFQLAQASPPSINDSNFNYSCYFEVQIYKDKKFKNFEKQFTLQNSIQNSQSLFNFASSSQQWSHYCENCSGAKDIYQGQKFTSQTEVLLNIPPPSFGEISVNFTYEASGHSTESENFLLRTSPKDDLPEQIYLQFPRFRGNSEMITASLFCKLQI